MNYVEARVEHGKSKKTDNLVTSEDSWQAIECIRAEFT